MQVDKNKMAEHLAKMLQCKTVSDMDQSRMDWAEFEKLHRVLEECYPLLHQKLEKQVITNHGLLYKWKGKSDAKPILLMAHQDVVPAEEDGWEYDPFAGKIADGYIWGRGAIDVKSMLCAEMEAVEYLLAQGFEPAYDIYLAYDRPKGCGFSW